MNVDLVMNIPHLYLNLVRHKVSCFNRPVRLMLSLFIDNPG